MKTSRVAIVLTLGLTAGLLTATSCAKAQPNITPSPVVISAVKATEVVHALDVVRDVAVTLSQEQPAVISAHDAQIVLTAHQSIVAVIGATPNGWKSTAESALDQLQKDLSAADAARLRPYIALVRTLVDAFVPASSPDPQLAPAIAASLATDARLP